MSYRERQQNTIRLPSDLRYISLAKFSLAVDPLSSANQKHKSANSYRVMTHDTDRWDQSNNMTKTM